MELWPGHPLKLLLYQELKYNLVFIHGNGPMYWQKKVKAGMAPSVFRLHLIEEELFIFPENLFLEQKKSYST